MVLSALLALSLSAKPSPAPRYVFLFVGDGMGIAQVSLAEAYRASIQGDSVGFAPTRFSRFPIVSLATTHCATRRITESAAAATALTTGSKADEEGLGLDVEGRIQQNLTELAAEAGMATGVATTVSVDHATPAGFYAHVANRGDFGQIRRQAAVSRLDFLGGAPFLAPDSVEPAPKTGWDTVRGRSALAARTTPHVLAIPSGKARPSLPWALDRSPDDTSLGLADLVREGARILEKSSPKGFFLMAEAGKIDWACHRNDARTMVGEVWDLDAAVGEAMSFAERHPGQVLIVVVADHETGGLSLGSGPTGYWTDFGLLRHQTRSQEAMEDSLALILAGQGWSEASIFSRLAEWTGLGRAKGLALGSADSASLREALGRSRTRTKAAALASTATRLLSAKAGVGWTSGAHTASPVPVYAWGSGSEAFQGRLDNTRIQQILSERVAPRK